MSVHARPEGSDSEQDGPLKRARMTHERERGGIVEQYGHWFDPSTATGLFKSLASTLGRTPADEDQVGITQFVDATSQSFSGIIKHRFTDFLVYEIGLDGQVVRLRDITGPLPPPPPRSKAPTTTTTTTTTTDDDARQQVKPRDEEPVLWNDDVASKFAPLLTPAKLDELATFVKAGSPHHQPQPKPESTAITFTTSPIEDKLARGQFHRSVREAFGGKLLSAHKEVSDTRDVVIEVNWAKGNLLSGRTKKGKRLDRGDAQELRESRAIEHDKLAKLPAYIEFTLLKQNKESHDAMSTLARLLNVTTRELGIAGTKDKRAVTVQRVSVKRSKRTTVEDVWRIAKNGGGNRGSRGGGGGGGGGFVDRNIRIGDVTYSERGLELGMLKGNKFVVTLRDIDPASIETIHRSMASLREHGFLNYYGMQRFGTAPVPTHLIGLALVQQQWQFAVDLILGERDGEHQDVAVARGLWRRGQRDEAIKAMPRRCTAERCVMEAYKKGNGKDHLGALSSIPKNLRLMYVHAWQSYIWNRLVSERVKLFGATQPVVGDLVYVKEGEEAAVAAAEQTASPVTTTTTSEEPAVKSNDPSSAESQQAYYASTSSLAKVRPLTQADLDASTYTIYDVVLPMPGFAVTYPSGELGDVYRRVILEDGVDPDQMWRKQKEYSLAGTYRHVVHKPAHVAYKLVVSTSTEQDLAQSDEDKLVGKPDLPVDEYDPESGLAPGQSLNLQIELELGSSTYATMALREILKSRTSAANQKGLTKEMEGRIGKGSTTTTTALEEDEEASTEHVVDCESAIEPRREGGGQDAI